MQSGTLPINEAHLEKVECGPIIRSHCERAYKSANKFKLEEIRKGYEETSGTFSSSVRNLSISGIAIAWLFMTREIVSEKSTLLLIALGLFVLTLFIDLIQNFILSLIWYKFYKKKVNEGKSEEEEANEPEDNNRLAWVLYVVKFLTLFIGYIKIFVYSFRFL